MILGIAGVTGVGKSYYKDKIVEELDFEKIKIITTREIRKGEKNNEDKIFVTKEELQKLKEEGKIAYDFEYLGNTYAYTKEELFSDKNMVFELHYSTVHDFKKICPKFKSLYLLPKDIKVPITKTKERGLKPEVEESRLKEIEEHYNKVMTDENLRNIFDHIIYNCYNKETDEKVIDTIRKMLIKK